MSELDVKKIEEAAFAAIDDIFSENKGSDDLILNLKSKILALDWEYSDKDIKELLEIFQNLKSRYTDKINSVIILMMSNVAKFLLLAKEKSPADTLSVLAYIVDFFVKYNSSEIDESEKKKYIQEIKRKYARLKEAISKVTQAQKDDLSEKNKEEVVVIDSKVETEEVKEKIPEVSNVSVDKQVTPEDLTKVITPIVKKVVSQVEYNLSTIIEENFKYITEKLRKFEDAIDKLEQKLDSLSELNISKNESTFAKEFISDKTLDAKPSPKTREFDFLQEDSEISFAPEIEEEKAEIEEVSEKEELVKDESKDVFDLDKEPESAIEEDGFDIEEKVLEAPKDIYPYVRLFELKDKIIALDDELILNMYKVSPSKAKKLYSKESFNLKELGGLFSKLSKKMRGSLSDKKDKELKKLEVQVYKYPDELVDKFKYAILVEGDPYKVLFVKDIYKNMLFLPEDKQDNDEDNVFDYKYKIDKIGYAYSFNLL
ncbi:MAG: hypothetical protein PWR24_1547 [Desulfonauticus sp.]|jgi:uncharacterized protein YqeY|nr:MAG: hypothetical protein XD41_1100 [Desulfonauticus sp. 38_4375]MDK2921990.1 hypothetical protein [Desulfonauticus sp.]